MIENDKNLVKIRTTIDDTGERMWAIDLGGDLYQVDNIPFFAYDLHCGDVVRALAPDDDHVPVIVRIVRRGGHKTLRIVFQATCSADERTRILSDLRAREVAYEGMTADYFALDAEPTADYPAVCGFLFELERRGLLLYETGTTSDEPAHQKFPSDDRADTGH
ncbi:MAG TPA: DUF4265 domain-containing protein [Candidatus Limnocylindria bacterium]